jgi:hypothetical protein
MMTSRFASALSMFSQQVGTLLGEFGVRTLSFLRTYRASRAVLPTDLVGHKALNQSENSWRELARRQRNVRLP